MNTVPVNGKFQTPSGWIHKADGFVRLHQDGLGGGNPHDYYEIPLKDLTKLMKSGVLFLHEVKYKKNDEDLALQGHDYIEFYHKGDTPEVFITINDSDRQMVGKWSDCRDICAGKIDHVKLYWNLNPPVRP
jgi:hypothetical protein